MEKSEEKKAGKISNKPAAWLGLWALAFLLILAGWQLSTAPEHSITVAIEGVKGNEGMLRLTVFDKEEGFPGDGQKALKLISVPARAGKLEVVIDKLPAGKYAIALLHDENENGEMDTNVVGYPKEGYGASNNQLPTFRAPSFAEAAFQVPLAEAALPIFIRY